MGLSIEDGKGTSNELWIDDKHRARVHAVTDSVAADISETLGRAFVWNSTFTTGGANIDTISIRNTDDTRHLHLLDIHMCSTVNQVWTLFKVTTGSPGGTLLTASNLKISSSITPNATAYGNAAVTGSLTGNTLGYWMSTANGMVEAEGYDYIVLGLNDTIALRASANGVVYVSVYGYYEDLD